MSSSEFDHSILGCVCRYTSFSGSEWLFVGFNSNEGYDKNLSGDCGYGVALYLEEDGNPRELVAATYINPTEQHLCALDRFDAQVGHSRIPFLPLFAVIT